MAGPRSLRRQFLIQVAVRLGPWSCPTPPSHGERLVFHLEQLLRECHASGSLGY